jgi:hypothetical protein
MSQEDWMNDPELDQLPTHTARLEGLKQLAEREQAREQAQKPIPSHYALSMAEMRAPAVPAVPVPAVPVPENAKTDSAGSALPALAPTTLTNDALITLAQIGTLAKHIDTLPLCADALVTLGKQLGAEVAFTALSDILREHHAEKTAPADPNDRHGAVRLAIELREQKKRWSDITRTVNAKGYRNQAGSDWQVHALRRAVERFADRMNLTVKNMERRSK